MRTKTLILTAAIGAAGVATSMAQVFSVNAVGYVTKTIPANGFALIANPLSAADNSINALFKPVPAGTQVFKFDSAKSSFSTATFDDIDNAFLPPAAGALTVVPGEGVFVRNVTTAAINITFVGEVAQGDLKNPLPKGLSIRSSQVPQKGIGGAGTAAAPGNWANLGMKGAAGDQIFQWNATTQRYDTSTFDDIDNTWLPALKDLEVGDAFFISKAAAGSWDRKFNVNQ